MSQLMLINQSPLKAKRKIMKRTAKQIAAGKKLGRLSHDRAVARRKELAKTGQRKTTSITKAGKKRTPTQQKRYVKRVINDTKRHYYPNPAKRRTKISLKNVLNQQIKPAAIQAGGAMLLDVGYGYFGHYIPDSMNTGMIKHATKGMIAVALGMIAGNFVNSKLANDLAMGAMTVTIHDAMKEAAGNYMPNIPLGSVDYYSPSPVMGYFSPDQGEGYTQNTGVGYYNSDTGTGFGEGVGETFDTSTI